MRLDKIRVLLVDDHKVLRDGLKSLLEQENDLDIVATAGTAEEGLLKAIESHVDVAVIDVSLPDRDGSWLLKRLKDEVDGIALVVLSMYSDEATVLRFLSSGADGYVCKSAEPREVITAIREVQAGRSYIQSDLVPLVANLIAKEESVPSPRLKLDERELDILRRVSKGYSNQKIADELFLSVSTIKAAFRSIFHKLDVSTRTEAVLIAMQSGEIDNRP